MKESLASFHRPHTFEDVKGQESVKVILEEQCRTGQVVHVYGFCGKTGSGKTTVARILANKVNDGIGKPYEIDAASNNGVDNVRAIIDEASKKCLVGKYKVFIIDEAHMLTTQAWNAFLKCLEEPADDVIFIFCTTDPQKIPPTVLNRMMIFNFNKISLEDIKDRLTYICNAEGYTNYEQCVDYIAKCANGGMRDAIALLEKCANYSTDLSIENVLQCLGTFNYNTFFELLYASLNSNEEDVLSIIENIDSEGKDLKKFFDEYLEFILDVYKYKIFSNFKMIKIPEYYSEYLNSAIGFDTAKDYYSYVFNKLNDARKNVKLDVNPKITIELTLLNIVRGL